MDLPHGPHRVLVADEVHDSADTLVLMLETEGVSARAAYDGESALALATSWNPDTVVLEPSLRNPTGYDVARDLRRKYEGAIRLIAYSARSGLEDRRKAADAGFDLFVIKTIDPDSLLACLGIETAALVWRSLELQVESVRGHVALGATLMRRAELLPDAGGWEICAFLERVIDANRLRILQLPMPPALQAQLWEALSSLELRIARFQRERWRGDLH